jgi:hypothetical protein
MKSGSKRSSDRSKCESDSREHSSNGGITLLCDHPLEKTKKKMMERYWAIATPSVPPVSQRQPAETAQITA